MTTIRTVQILAALAFAASVCALVALAVVALQTGAVHSLGFAGSLIVLVGAGSRLRKSSALRAQSGKA